MDTIALEYLFISIIVLMVFFTFLIGTHKMLQVIIATTCITIIVLGWSGFIDFLSYTILQHNSLTIFGLGASNIAAFLKSARLTTSIVILGLLLAYVLQYSSPLIVNSSNMLDSKAFQLILSPLAIFTTIVSLVVAVVGTDIFSLSYLASVQAKFGATSFITILLNYMPLFIFIQGLLAIFLIFRKEKKISDLTYTDIVEGNSK